ncbi:DUF1048 domain-containing protein [Streptomyces canus]|uniref:DUF1048 domain-containing protein n=1 Tax=Streptomyces canus TaxID=58343 RepID=UPI00386AE43A
MNFWEKITGSDLTREWKAFEARAEALPDDYRAAWRQIVAHLFSYGDFTGVTIVWADSAYAGKLVDWAKQHLILTIKPVSRPKDASGFVVLPRRWVIERSLARMMHAHRHARDYERLVQHSETLITRAAITLMTRRLTRGGKSPARLPVTPPPLTQAA